MGCECASQVGGLGRAIFLETSEPPARIGGANTRKGEGEDAKKHVTFDRMTIDSIFNLPKDRSTVGRRPIDALNIVHSNLSQVHGLGKEPAVRTALCEEMGRLGKTRESVLRIIGLAEEL